MKKDGDAVQAKLFFKLKKMKEEVKRIEVKDDTPPEKMLDAATRNVLWYTTSPQSSLPLYQDWLRPGA